jgi:murein DD-endopeptidase MepM/ murein hydrolase activator NlpD
VVTVALTRGGRSTDDRRHEGTDVFAPRGTDVVAVAGGIVTRTTADRPTRLGGITVSVSSGDHRHYYAHLEAIAPGLAVGDEVAAGDLLGWVGTTGNARGTPPHLHLGWYAEDVAVNPYASLVVACASDAEVAAGDAGQAASLLTVDAVARARGQGWRTPAPDTMAR